MTRAVVIKTYGDPALSKGMADAMEQRVIRMDDGELATVKAECKRLDAINGVRAYGDSVRWESVAGALAVKYSTRPHGRLYGAILGVWALIWLSITEWADYLSAWNRGEL